MKIVFENPEELPAAKYYVSAIDNFMSSWGNAKDQMNLVVLLSNDADEAEFVRQELENREEMSDVEVRTYPPVMWKSSRYYKQYTTRELTPVWYP